MEYILFLFSCFRSWIRLFLLSCCCPFIVVCACIYRLFYTPSNSTVSQASSGFSTKNDMRRLRRHHFNSLARFVLALFALGTCFTCSCWGTAPAKWAEKLGRVRAFPGSASTFLQPHSQALQRETWEMPLLLVAMHLLLVASCTVIDTEIKLATSSKRRSDDCTLYKICIMQEGSNSVRSQMLALNISTCKHHWTTPNLGELWATRPSCEADLQWPAPQWGQQHPETTSPRLQICDLSWAITVYQVSWVFESS